LLVVMPTWLGDCVMATPTLRALRELYPQAHVSALIQRAVRPVLDHCPWVDRVIAIRKRRKGRGDRRRGPMALARRLSQARFDTAVLLPNSFRSAMLVTLAGVPRRIGYDRDGRGFMLTDRLLPRRKPGGDFLPVPTRDYYLGLALYMGASRPDPTMRLFIDGRDDAAADRLLEAAGLAGVDRPLVLLNPGASKPEKRWPAERFARLADALAEAHGAAVAVTGSPREREVIGAVVAAARSAPVDLTRHGLDLTTLKPLVNRASLLVTNDTGPRHVAAAFDTPVVTLFGPTAPAWTEIGFADERQVVAPCGAIEAITLEQVVEAAAELLRRPRRAVNHETTGDEARRIGAPR
jgi:heptosyltransferase-2